MVWGHSFADDHVVIEGDGLERVLGLGEGSDSSVPREGGRVMVEGKEAAVVVVAGEEEILKLLGSWEEVQWSWGLPESGHAAIDFDWVSLNVVESLSPFQFPTATLARWEYLVR